MKQAGSILVIDDDQDILVAAKLLLKRHFETVVICNTPEQIPLLMAKQTFAAILLDMNFSPGESCGSQGLLWLENILKISPQAVVIMITAHAKIDTAIEAIKLGATDFIAKPWHNEKVVATLTSAVKLGNSRAEADQLKQKNHLLTEISNQSSGSKILGNSVAMQKVHQVVSRAAPTDANVLILGENGTGKELLARDIHAKSLRADAVFMSVDLGAVSESLFESELFGHQKGAFTGAKEARIGRLLAADGGTLFLDEIGNLPLHLQAKLLTVLEQRTVIPVGANIATPFNVRIIAATNVSQASLQNEGNFRQDLLYRLNTVEITLPPLRERLDDIEPIAQYYRDFYSKKYQKTVVNFSEDALAAMKVYSWPGNVRALRHAIERGVILTSAQELSAEDLQLPTSIPSTNALSTMPSNTANTITSNTAQAIPNAPLTSSSADEIPSEGELNLAELEKNTVATALKKYKYNISHAAKALGLTRAALYRRMEKYGF